MKSNEVLVLALSSQVTWCPSTWNNNVPALNVQLCNVQFLLSFATRSKDRDLLFCSFQTKFGTCHRWRYAESLWGCAFHCFESESQLDVCGCGVSFASWQLCTSGTELTHRHWQKLLSRCQSVHSEAPNQNRNWTISVVVLSSASVRLAQ